MPRRRGDAARADRAPLDRGLEARRRRPRPRLLDGGPEDHGAALQGPAHDRRRAQRPPVDGGQHARLERRAHVPLPPPRRRALERRRAADGRRLRLHVDAHARARDPHLVPHGGRRDRGGPRRPHARDHAARAAQLLPLRPRLAVGLPLAPAPLRAARGGLAPAGEHRLQRPVHTGRVRRRARAPDREPVLERAARERRARSRSRSSRRAAR